MKITSNIRGQEAMAFNYSLPVLPSITSGCLADATVTSQSIQVNPNQDLVVSLSADQWCAYTVQTSQDGSQWTDALKLDLVGGESLAVRVHPEGDMSFARVAVVAKRTAKRVAVFHQLQLSA